MNNSIQPNINPFLVNELGFLEQKLATKQNFNPFPQKSVATFGITIQGSRGSLRGIIAWKMEAFWQRFTIYRMPLLSFITMYRLLGLDSEKGGGTGRTQVIFILLATFTSTIL